MVLMSFWENVIILLRFRRILLLLSQLLEEYKASERKKEVLDVFLKKLWNNKYIFKKYKKYFRYKVRDDLLDNRPDLIELFNKYSEVEYIVCKSYYDKKLDAIAYIRIHINNMYGYLFDKDVYYDSDYYKLLLTPKQQYFRLVALKKEKGNLDNINSNEIKDIIEQAFREAELIKQKCVANKHVMKFSQYKKLINQYMEKLFNNYMPTEEYEKQRGWDLDIKIDGWLEDNYIVSYFCKSLTGYLRNYIRDNKLPLKKCKLCGKNIPRRNTYCPACYQVYRRQYKTKKQKEYRVDS